MKLSKTIMAVLTSAVITCGLFTPTSRAVGITGDVDFFGNVTLDTNSLATATRVTQFTSYYGVAGGLSVASATGSFSSVPIGSFAAFTAPYAFNPASSYPNFWQVGGFNFNLLSSSVINQNAFFLEVRGVGIITGNGFDPTPGTWSFTLINSSGAPQQSFRFGNVPAALPDGGSALMLLGIAVAGVEAFRRSAKLSERTVGESIS